MGCCGCGCLLLGIVLLLILAIGGGSLYMTYNLALKVTDAEPAQIPTFDGGDDVYSKTVQKMQAFNRDAQNHTGTTLHLTSDEINTLIARNPAFSENRIQAFVTLTGDQGRVQASAPTSLLSSNMLKGRFLNVDATIGLGFDTNSKNISFDLKSIMAGTTAAPPEDLPLLQSTTDGLFNALLQKDPNAKAFLSHVTSMAIKDSELVIEAN
jgi:hypothetical protein